MVVVLNVMLVMSGLVAVNAAGTASWLVWRNGDSVELGATVGMGLKPVCAGHRWPATADTGKIGAHSPAGARFQRPSR